MNELENYLTPAEPFGPLNSSEMHKPEIMMQLFEQHNRIYQNLRQNPSIIIGRRGSGKTTYLHNTLFNKRFDFSVEIITGSVLTEVKKHIKDMGDDDIFVETVAEIWEMILWLSVFTTVRPNMPGCAERDLIDAFLAKFGVSDQTTVDTIVWTITKVLSERAKEHPAGIIAEMLSRMDNINFKKVKNAVNDYLERTKETFVILMDSLEDFHLDDTTIAQAMQGLLYCIGSMNRPSDRVYIQFCIPAEEHQRFLRLAVNPIKDFRRTLTLRWTAGELIFLAAQRLKLYLSLHRKDIYYHYDRVNTTNRREAHHLLKAFLPEIITNRLGTQEETISYILRHTQLSPRQLIMILNSVFTVRNGQWDENHKINERAVIKGIRDMEHALVKEVYAAYKPIFPNAELICKHCLPELNRKFSNGDLQRAFRIHGVKAFGGDYFFDFRRMLIQIGAIGRVTAETDMYIEGLFEYTLPHELVPNTEDTFCIHPLFSGIHSSEKSSGKTLKPVYPYGSDIYEDEDYRDEDLSVLLGLKVPIQRLNAKFASR